MTSTSGDTTVKFRPDAPPIVCGECGFRTARIAALLDPSGAETGTAVVCLPCRERERARTAGAAGAAATAAARRAAGRPAHHGAVPRQRSAPAPTPAPADPGGGPAHGSPARGATPPSPLRG